MSTNHRADKVLDYILSNASKLTPEKIEALSNVLSAVKDFNEAAFEPNTIPVVENQAELTENEPIDFSDVTGVEVDGRHRKTLIYKAA